MSLSLHSSHKLSELLAGESEPNPDLAEIATSGPRLAWISVPKLDRGKHGAPKLPGPLSNADLEAEAKGETAGAPKLPGPLAKADLEAEAKGETAGAPKLPGPLPNADLEAEAEAKLERAGAPKLPGPLPNAGLESPKLPGPLPNADLESPKPPVECLEENAEECGAPKPPGSSGAGGRRRAISLSKKSLEKGSVDIANEPVVGAGSLLGFVLRNGFADPRNRLLLPNEDIIEFLIIHLSTYI
jgi:hypothetical protein